MGRARTDAVGIESCDDGLEQFVLELEAALHPERHLHLLEVNLAGAVAVEELEGAAQLRRSGGEPAPNLSITIKVHD